MKKRTKVKDKSFILDKRKDPEGYSGSFCGKRGDGMACNYFGKNYIWVGVTKNNVGYKKRRTWRYGYINSTSFILNPHNNALERYHDRAEKNLSFS